MNVINEQKTNIKQYGLLNSDCIYILIAYMTLQILKGTVRLSVPQGETASKKVPITAQMKASDNESQEQILPINMVPRKMAKKQAADPS
jgi:hypothetical protein